MKKIAKVYVLKISLYINNNNNLYLQKKEKEEEEEEPFINTIIKQMKEADKVDKIVWKQKLKEKKKLKKKLAKEVYYYFIFY